SFIPFRLTSISSSHFSLFLFTDTSTTYIYTLSLHDALPIYIDFGKVFNAFSRNSNTFSFVKRPKFAGKNSNPQSLRYNSIKLIRSEEHTSELQSPCNLVCRLLLEKKKKKIIKNITKIRNKTN